MNSETLKETEKKSKTVNKSSAKIAKIEPVQKEAIDLSDNASTEASLLESLQIILRMHQRGPEGNTKNVKTKSGNYQIPARLPPFPPACLPPFFLLPAFTYCITGNVGP